jgi:hypothetical protein
MEFDFKITSGKVHLSDPCYKPGTSCGLYDIPARIGNWHVKVDHINSFGNRVQRWKAYHEDFKDEFPLSMSNEFGVDSGQFGIFDSEIYDSESSYGEHGFYNDCCENTLSNALCGVVSDQGFVSSSGYGDGGYVGFASFDSNGSLVSFEIEFISHVDEEEDDED